MKNNLKSNTKIKIKATNITKRFDLMKTKSEKVLNILSLTSKRSESFWALKGVNFEVRDGESVAIVGLNGSGKSTLLNVIGGVYPPTTGELTVNGETSIISIGAGLRGPLSGSDNIRLKLLMLGYKKKQVKQMLPNIIKFSELGDFIDQPVKSYSSGMKAKLGFSIMVHTDPDIMMVDEALSVGDATFTKKSFDKIKDFKKEGKSIFFVAHSNAQVKEIADYVIWMHFGQMFQFGPVNEVLPRYSRWLKAFNKWPKEKREKYIVDFKNSQKNFEIKKIIENEVYKNEGVSVNLKEAKTRQERQQLLQKKDQLDIKKERMVNRATKKALKRVVGKHFGIINWAIVLTLLTLVGTTAYGSIDQSIRYHKSEQLEQKKRISKMNSSSSKVNTPKSTSSPQVSYSDSIQQSTTSIGEQIPETSTEVNSYSSYIAGGTTDDSTVPDTSVVDPNAQSSDAVNPVTDSTTNPNNVADQ